MYNLFAKLHRALVTLFAHRQITEPTVGQQDERTLFSWSKDCQDCLCNRPHSLEKHLQAEEQAVAKLREEIADLQRQLREMDEVETADACSDERGAIVWSDDGCLSNQPHSQEQHNQGVEQLCQEIGDLDEDSLFTLFHNVNLMAMLYPQDYEQLWFSHRDQHFTRVAEIAAPVERLFALSNHIDTDWTQNPEVIWHLNGSLRSTSVGDVFVSAHGQAWMVMPHGFKELQEAEHA